MDANFVWVTLYGIVALSLAVTTVVSYNDGNDHRFVVALTAGAGLAVLLGIDQLLEPDGPTEIALLTGMMILLLVGAIAGLTAVRRRGTVP